MKTINTLFAVALVSLFAAAAAAQPEPPPGGGGPPGGRMGPPPGPPPLELVIVEHAEELGLTAEQAAQIQELAESARTELGALHRAVGEAFRGGEMADFLAAERTLRERQAELMAAVLGVLTDEQWHALQQLLPPPPPPPPRPCDE